MEHCGVENCGKAEEQDHAAWVWGAVAAGVVLGAVGVIWVMQYRKPDRSMERLLRRAYDRIEDIEAALGDLLSAELETT
jgi:hypothetical protein